MNAAPPPPAYHQRLTQGQIDALQRLSQLNEKGTQRPINVRVLQQIARAAERNRRANAPRDTYRTPFVLGSKTKGARDASLRSSANRRKS